MDCEQVVETAQTIDGWMMKRELEWLFSAARMLSPGATWVEAGVWKGRSFFSVAMALPPGSRLVAVDSFSSDLALPTVPTADWVWDHFQAVFRAVHQLRDDLLLSVMQSDTAEASQLFPDGSVDVAFLDADHSRAGFERDVEAWWPKIRSGGLLCGHDYNPGFPDVIAVVDERFPNRELVVDTSIWTVRRQDSAVPATGAPQAC